jgi:hypothetical protein
MAHFESFLAYDQFKRHVTQRRYLWDEIANNFLDSIVESSLSRTITLEIGTELWRAGESPKTKTEPRVIYRDGDYELTLDLPELRSKDAMLPRANIARESRANASGIAYLYVADDGNTAIAETRPWIGSYRTLATLALTRQMKIVDCCTRTLEPSIARKFEQGQLTVEDIEPMVWSSICHSFSEPVERIDGVPDYVPTQILAEAFHHKGGFDGVKYKSSVGRGNNYVLFNWHDLTFVKRQLFVITKFSDIRCELFATESDT